MIPQNLNQLDEVTQTLIPRLMKKIEADAGSALLYNGDTLRVHKAIGLKKNRGRNAKIPTGVGITGQAAQSYSAQWVPDVSERENYIEGVEGAKWEFAIPVFNDDFDVSLIFDFEATTNKRPASKTRAAVKKYLEVRQQKLLNLAEKAYYKKCHYTDNVSTLMSKTAFINAIDDQFSTQLENGILLTINVEPNTDTAICSLGDLEQALEAIGRKLDDGTDPSTLVTRLYNSIFSVFTPFQGKKRMANNIRRCLSGVGTIKEINRQSAKTVEEAQTLIDRTFINPSYSNQSDLNTSSIYLDKILQKKAIDLNKQPIKHTQYKRNLGHELFVRGPKDTPLRSPKKLFRTAYNDNRIVELDTLITKKALAHYPDTANQTLFLNIERKTLANKQWRTTFIDIMEDKVKLNVCLELTEHGKLTELKPQIDQLNDQLGDSILFAIDDFGTGSANFSSIIELKPDVIKLDRSLIRNIDENFDKRSLVESILSFSSDSDIDVLAEGIEKQMEWETIRELQVNLAQGYYFSKPEPLWASNSTIKAPA